MSRGHGARQRGIIAYLDGWPGTPGFARSAAEITWAVDGPRSSAAAQRATRRAIAGLLADGTLTETRRPGKYGRVASGGGRRLRVYMLAPAARTHGTRWPCGACGRRIMVTEPGKGGAWQAVMCSRCYAERASAHAERASAARRAEVDSIRGDLRTDDRLNKLITLALDSGATDAEAIAALTAARKRRSAAGQASGAPPAVASEAPEVDAESYSRCPTLNPPGSRMEP